MGSMIDLDAPQSTGAPPQPPLRRATDDRVIGGVCAGIARHLHVDPLVVRILAVVLAVADGIGLVAYLIAWLLIPEEGDEARRPEGGRVAGVVIGGLMIVGGVSLLADRIFPDVQRFVWPVALIVCGVALALRWGQR